MKRTMLMCLMAVLLRAGPLPAQQPVQTGRITGTVVDAQTGQPITGANITVAGTQHTAASGANGQFVISAVAPGSYTVRAAYLGYGTRDVEVDVRAGESATVRLQMEVQAIALQEIVAVGYGTQRRRDMTGAVASVNLDAVRQTPVVSVDQLLQGTAPGVLVTQASSAPGGGISIRIRGGTSVSEGVSNEPLYVIDGFPIEVDYAAQSPGSGGRNAGNTVAPNPLTSLNPRDIESIEILKDASATAIYGARAANGVVIITTRGGQSGPPRITFESTAGVQGVSRRYSLLDGPEYAAFVNEWAVGNNLDPVYANPAAVPSIDWQDQIFRRAALQNYQVSVSGGTSGENATRYAVSGGYFQQDGVVLGSAFERLSLRLNLNQQIGPRIRVGTNLTGSRVLTDFSPTDGSMNGSEAGAVAGALQYIPTLPIRNEDGTFTQMLRDAPTVLNPSDVPNPVAMVTEMDDRLGDNRVLGNAFGEFEVMPGLRFRSSIGANVSNRTRDTYWPRSTLRGAQAGGQAIRARVEATSFLNENTLTFIRGFGANHSVNSVIGMTRQVQENTRTTMTNENFLNDVLGYRNIGAGNRSGGPLVGSSEDRTTLASFLGRANYSLLDRYMFTVTGRYDGSSRFGPDRKWGFFPSAAIAWRASEEPFLREIGMLSDLKVRTSYGATGNAGVRPYQSLAVLGATTATFGNDIVTGYRPASLANHNLGWETTYQFDAGVDLAVLDNTFTVTADYYNRRTEDLLLEIQLPLETGFRFAFQNAGTVRNRGVELAVAYNPLRGDGFSSTRLSTGFNYSRNRNIVLDLGPLETLRVRGISGNFNFPGTDVRVGHPIGVFFGYRTDGMFRDSASAANHPARLPQRPFQAGEFRILDLSGPDGEPDGIIDERDRTIIGDPNPDFNIGWSTSLAFRGFEFTSLLTGSFGADVLNLNLIRIEGGSPATNVVRERWHDRWTPENPDAKYPRLGHTAGAIGANYVDTMLEDGSYLRLSSLGVAWNLPARWVERRGFREARLMLTGNNLVTWTRYSGYNPEVSSMGVGNVNRGVDVGAYPLARTFSLGVSVGY